MLRNKLVHRTCSGKGTLRYFLIKRTLTGEFRVPKIYHLWNIKILMIHKECVCRICSSNGTIGTESSGCSSTCFSFCYLVFPFTELYNCSSSQRFGLTQKVRVMSFQNWTSSLELFCKRNAWVSFQLFRLSV